MAVASTGAAPSVTEASAPRSIPGPAGVTTAAAGTSSGAGGT